MCVCGSQRPGGALRGFALLIVAALLTGCSFDLALFSSDVESSVVGKTKDEILSCLGEPSSRSSMDGVDEWRYDTAAATSFQYCQVAIELKSGKATAISYRGPTGGIVQRDQDCARLMQGCFKQKR